MLGRVAQQGDGVEPVPDRLMVWIDQYGANVVTSAQFAGDVTGLPVVIDDGVCEQRDDVVDL